jgi:hypothetical protein
MYVRRPNAILESIGNNVANFVAAVAPKAKLPANIKDISEAEIASTLQDRSLRAATVVENLTANPQDLTVTGLQYLVEDFFIVRKDKQGHLEFKVNDKSQILLNENRGQIIESLAELAKHTERQSAQELVPTSNGDKERNEMALQILNGFVEYSKGNMNWFHLNRHVKPIWEGAAYRDYVNVPVIDVIAADQSSSKHIQAIATLMESMSGDDASLFRVNFNKSLDFKLNGIERTYNQTAYNKKLLPYQHENTLGSQVKSQLMKSLQDICVDKVLRIKMEQEDTAGMGKIYESIAWGLTNFIPHNEYGEFAKAAVALMEVPSKDSKNFNQRHEALVKIIQDNAETIHKLEKAYEKAQVLQKQNPQNAELLEASQKAEEKLRLKKQEVEASYQFFGAALEKFEDIGVKSLFLSKLLGENDENHNGLFKLIGIKEDDPKLIKESEAFIRMREQEAKKTLQLARSNYQSLTNLDSDKQYENLINTVMKLDTLDSKYLPDRALNSYDKSSIQALIKGKKEQKKEIEDILLPANKLGLSLTTVDLDSQQGVKAAIVNLEKESKGSTDTAVKEQNAKLIDLLNAYRDFHEIARLDAKIQVNTSDRESSASSDDWDSPASSDDWDSPASSDVDLINVDRINSYANRYIAIEAARNECLTAQEAVNKFELSSYRDELKAEFIEDRTKSMEHESYRFLTAINPNAKQMKEIHENLFAISDMYANKQQSAIDFDLITEKLSIYFQKLLHLFEIFMNSNQHGRKEASVGNE